MTARKGDEGYWIDARGAYGRFDRDDGVYANDRAGWMPIFGLKRGDTLWWGRVTGGRCDYRFHAVAKGGRYEAFPRFGIKELRAYYPLHQDLVVEYRRLDGADANYVGYAKAYRRHQVAHGGVRTVKERMKGNDVLDYLSESFVIRISQHCRKQVLKDHTLRMTRDAAERTAASRPYAVSSHRRHDAAVARRRG